jgi:hypothetical protein
VDLSFLDWPLDRSKSQREADASQHEAVPSETQEDGPVTPSQKHQAPSVNHNMQDQMSSFTLSERPTLDAQKDITISKQQHHHASQQHLKHLKPAKAVTPKTTESVLSTVWPKKLGSVTTTPIEPVLPTVCSKSFDSTSRSTCKLVLGKKGQL